jgi:hypothetical protein
MDMAKACLRDGTPFGVCLIRDGAEVGAPATPCGIGTMARIAAWDMAQLGVLDIVALGETRFRIREHRVQPDGLARAAVAPLPEAGDMPVPESCEPAARLLARLIEQHGEHFPLPHRLDSSAWVSARLAEVLPLPLPAKQALLEMDDAGVRLEEVNRLLSTAVRE